MNTTLEVIPLSGLAIAFIPVAIVVLLLHRWSLDTRTAIYAMARMLQIDPWYAPRQLIPLAGMIFGAAGISAALFLHLVIRQSETLLANSNPD